jgi:hypothetical protein
MSKLYNQWTRAPKIFLASKNHPTTIVKTQDQPAERNKVSSKLITVILSIKTHSRAFLAKAQKRRVLLS